MVSLFKLMSKRDVFHPGQFLNYRAVLKIDSPERELFLAVPVSAYETFFQLPMPKGQVEDFQIKLLVYDPQEEVIVLWKN